VYHDWHHDCGTRRPAAVGLAGLLEMEFPRGKKMMSNRVVAFAAMGVFAVAFSVSPAKASSGKVSATYSATEAVTVGQTHLKPGTYSFEAVEGQNQVEILKNGKEVGTVSCQWVKLPTKAPDTEIQTDAGRVTQVNFRGKDEAAKIG
jgi:hypothetical protein